MKQILLIMLLVSLALPGASQQKGKHGDKKYTTVSSFFRDLPEKYLSGEKVFKHHRWEDNTLEIRNNACADSLLRFEAEGYDYNLVNVAREFPVYYPGTNLIKEMETWQKDWDDEFLPYMKKVASYDDQNRITRTEAHYWDGNDWEPWHAEEFTYDYRGEQVFYGYYSYYGKTMGWTLESGHRAVDEYDASNLLISRIWQEFPGTEWYNILKEEYFHNEDGIVEEIIEYIEYDEWSDTWEKDIRMVFVIDNSVWSIAYIYIWDDAEQQWLQWLRQSEMTWFDFDLQKPLGVSVAINGEFYPGYRQPDGKHKDETVWVNLLRMSSQYNDSGLMKLTMMELWNGSQNHYYPINKHEMNYDHFSNITYDVLSWHDGSSWVISFGTKVDFAYNAQNSIESFNVSYYTYGYPDNQFETYLRYEYYYGDGTTWIQQQRSPESLAVYPNPASSDIYVVWNGKGDLADISIIGMDGKLVSHYEGQPIMPGQPIRIEISDLKRGVYIVRCANNESQQLARFIKN